ncbi:MAG: hypothetical protein RML12_00670 [Xanthomonadales bacterium]|nr:hypothetical protein [Xanthomonadales bacterium]
MRSGGAGLPARGEAVVEGGHGQPGEHEPLGGRRGEAVELAQDEGAPGEEARRMAVLVADLEDRPGQAQPALDRPVGVGVRAERDGADPVARAGEGRAQALGGIGLREDPGLEVEAG